MKTSRPCRRGRRNARSRSRKPASSNGITTGKDKFMSPSPAARTPPSCSISPAVLLRIFLPSTAIPALNIPRTATSSRHSITSSGCVLKNKTSKRGSTNLSRLPRYLKSSAIRSSVKRSPAMSLPPRRTRTPSAPNSSREIWKRMSTASRTASTPTSSTHLSRSRTTAVTS